MTRQNVLFCLVSENRTTQLREVNPSPERRTLNKRMNDRKHLVSAEVDKLIEATKDSRNAARDRCFLLLMFRHGFGVSGARAPLSWRKHEQSIEAEQARHISDLPR